MAGQNPALTCFLLSQLVLEMALKFVHCSIEILETLIVSDQYLVSLAARKRSYEIGVLPCTSSALFQLLCEVKHPRKSTDQEDQSSGLATCSSPVLLATGR